MKIKDMVYTAMFTALVAVLGLVPAFFIPPYTVPITIQTLGVMLAGSILGARRGGLSLVLVVLLVAVGAHILSGGRGGFGVIMGPTGGFLLSWPIATFVIGYLVEKNWARLNYLKLLLINTLGGIVVIYAVGVPYASAINETPVGAELMRSIVFLPGDALKIVLASYIALRVKKIKPLIEPSTPKNNHLSA